MHLRSVSVTDYPFLVSPVQSGKLSLFQRGRLEQLINQYKDALTEKLSLTHLMEYEMQLLDTARQISTISTR